MHAIFAGTKCVFQGVICGQFEYKQRKDIVSFFLFNIYVYKYTAAPLERDDYASLDGCARSHAALKSAVFFSAQDHSHVSFKRLKGKEFTCSHHPWSPRKPATGVT